MNRRLWTVVAGLLFVYLLVGLWTTQTQTKPLDIAGSAMSSGKHGTMAIERTWQQLKLPWNNWGQIPGFLPRTSNAAFVSVEPQSSIYQKQDVGSLIDFAAKGNTVVWVTSNSDIMLKKFNVTLAQSSTSTVGNISSSHSNWNNLSFQTTKQLAGAGLNSAGQLFKDQNGQVLGAVFSQGKGQVIVWSAPSVWENGTIGKAGNFQFIWSLIGNHKVFWDEYGHGYSSQSLMGWMFHGWSKLALVLFIIAFLLYLYHNLWRFGPVRNPQLEQPMLGTDFMDALAWHMSRPALRQNQYEHLVPLVQKRLGQHSQHRGVATIEAATQWIEGRRAAKLSAAWQAWMRLADGGYQAKRWREFLKLTRTLLKRVEEYRDEHRRND